ncbi:MAG: HEPN domain-containing protein [Cellvibrionaceae bacterium]|nr:HEPN domain-containing protein [Cellvibrionaceae bacterium]
MVINTDLTHLPEGKQHTIAEIRRVILNEFEGEAGRHEWIVWIILFGSHARGTHVDNPINGYISDYDILVAVNGRELADDLKFWYGIEDKIDRLTRSPINLIVHTHEEIAQWLKEGHYFFSDIRKEGIYLYTSKPNKGLPEPKHLTNAERWPVAQEHYEQWFEGAEQFLLTSNMVLEKGWLKLVAFNLHQATERFYACILLVLSNYRPRTHNIKNLRNMAIDKTSPESPLNDIFPGQDKFQRRCFERLKRAYIDSRYSEHYKITEEELEWLSVQVEKLKDATQLFCESHIEALKTS